MAVVAINAITIITKIIKIKQTLLWTFSLSSFGIKCVLGVPAQNIQNDMKLWMHPTREEQKVHNNNDANNKKKRKKKKDNNNNT